MATAGIPVSFHWDRKKGSFNYRFKADSAIAAPTVIYIPPEFGANAVITTVLRYEYKPDEQRLLVYNDGKEGEMTILVKR